MSLHDIRHQNLLVLYTEFSKQALKDDPINGSHGVDSAFASKIQISKSLFSSYKNGHLNIGNRNANQITALMGKPKGWLDEVRGEAIVTQEEQDLARFIKLATRAFKRANSAERKSLTDQMQASLKR